MQTLKRNERKIEYCLYTGHESVTETDEWGNTIETGGQKISYSAPVSLTCTVSPASGRTAVEAFGQLDGFDRMVTTCDTSCPIDEESILFIDKGYAVNADGDPLPDYKVRRVAKSKNMIAIAVTMVEGA